jgi:hypothetical protein
MGVTQFLILWIQKYYNLLGKQFINEDENTIQEILEFAKIMNKSKVKFY